MRAFFDDPVKATALTPWLAVFDGPLRRAREAYFVDRGGRVLVAMEYEVQRLELGDVVLMSLPGQDEELEATVVRDIDRTATTVRATMRVKGQEDFVQEWPLGELVTVVRGP